LTHLNFDKDIFFTPGAIIIPWWLSFWSLFVRMEVRWVLR